MDTTSPSLLSRVRDPADAVAWRSFDSRYGELIVRYGRRLGLQHADAEDLRQIVMLRLAGALSGFEYDPARGRFRSFLGRIVQNEAARYRTRRVRRAPPVMVDEVAVSADDASPSADLYWEQEWRYHHLRQALRSVRETFESRSVSVFEHLLAGEPVENVAQAFGISVQAVHKIKQRIRDRLGALIVDQIRAEDAPHGG